MLFAAYSRISDVDTGTFKYFIKVVPTEYQGQSGASTSCSANDATLLCACISVSDLLKQAQQPVFLHVFQPQFVLHDMKCSCCAGDV